MRWLSLPDLLGPMGASSRLRTAAINVLLERTHAVYARNVRSPYTSDLAGDRERAMARLFAVGIAVQERQCGESELLADDADRRDIFELHQPRARLEDLVIARRPDLDDVSISFGVRSITLLVGGHTHREAARRLGDTLEAIAARLCV